jgi:AmmeMemoRadiSam system protein B
MAEDRPRLRQLEAFPIEQDGHRMMALRDPSGLTDEVVALPLPLLDLVSLFDGEHSIDEMRAILTQRHGEAPSAEQIAALAQSLDAHGFLDSARFAEKRRAIEVEFLANPIRPAAHAGGAYAGERDALAAQLAGFFAHADGPGDRAHASGSTGPLAGERPVEHGIRGLIAPHIDFHRGGPTYAWAYRELIDRSEADLFVVLGTCHAGMADPFSATLKPFDTPLGAVPVDRDFFEALERRYKGGLLASEGAHRNEHSIELQAVMLQHLFGARRPFTMLPVLASYLHEAVWARTDPEADPRVPRFIDALLETMAATSRKVVVIAGVDLAHVGPRFGDADANTETSLAAVAAADDSMLESVMAGDPTGFFASVAHDGDARRICGLSPIYTFLRVLPGVRGRLIRYRQWPDPAGAVTFCAAAFP